MFAWPARRAQCAFVLVLVMAVVAAGCGGSVFGRQFEYEEEIFLSLDGSVTVVVNASLPALVTLRGAALNTAADARVDRDAVRAFYECAGVEVVRVSRPWTREGRRFVQVRIDADDLRVLSDCRAFSWATYSLTREQGTMRYTQRIGAIAPAGAPGETQRFGGTSGARRVVRGPVRRCRDHRGVRDAPRPRRVLVLGIDNAPDPA